MKHVVYIFNVVVLVVCCIFLMGCPNGGSTPVSAGTAVVSSMGGNYVTVADDKRYDIKEGSSINPQAEYWVNQGCKWKWRAWFLDKTRDKAESANRVGDVIKGDCVIGPGSMTAEFTFYKGQVPLGAKSIRISFYCGEPDSGADRVYSSVYDLTDF